MTNLEMLKLQCEMAGDYLVRHGLNPHHSHLSRSDHFVAVQRQSTGALQAYGTGANTEDAAAEAIVRFGLHLEHQARLEALKHILP